MMDRGIALLQYWVSLGVENARHDVDNIIRCNERRVHRIETVLDTLLGYMHLGKGEEEFRFLNDYYHLVNQQNADAYDRIYEEFFSQET